MPITELFSKRQKKLRGEIPDVFTYTNIPNELKVQIIHIINDAIGIHINYRNNNYPREAFKYFHSTLCREYGLFRLGESYEDDKESVLNFFLKTRNTDYTLDIIEIIFLYIDRYIPTRGDYYTCTSTKCKPEEAIAELNQRFKEHAFGYQYEAGEIIRVDSTYIHSEIVKPTIALLWNKKFQGANEEYLKAHEHYRHGRNKECLTECLKALESTLKIICNEKGWTFNATDTSKKLIQTCFQNGLVPSFSQNQFTSLQNLLESGVPTIRNKLGGHGQGQVPQTVDDGITRYALNLTGTNIIFLIEQCGIK